MRRRFHEETAKLRRFANSDGVELEFLGYRINLDSGELFDQLEKTAVKNEREIETLLILLKHYCKAEPEEKTGKLVRFRDLPGGHAYEAALIKRAVQPVAEAFGDEPEGLVESARLLKGSAIGFGDVSVKIPAMPGIPLVYILWRAGEFPASATVLFHESASHYLPTEDLAVLAELTTSRLLQAWETVHKGRI